MISRFLNPQGGPPSGGNDPFSVLQREVNRAFDEVFRGLPGDGTRRGGTMGGFAPSLDVRETDEGLEIAAELPGMSEEDVDLRLEGDLLTLAGEKKEERAQEGGGMHLTERSFGRFQRSFRLPYRPEPNDVQAQFDKGVLRILLPRPQQQSRAADASRSGRGRRRPRRGSRTRLRARRARRQAAGAAADDPAMGGQGSGKVG